MGCAGEGTATLDSSKKDFVTLVMKHMLERNVILAYAVADNDRFYRHGVIWFLANQRGTTGATVKDRWIFCVALELTEARIWVSKTWAEAEGPPAISCPREFLEYAAPPMNPWVGAWRDLVMRFNEKNPPGKIHYTAAHPQWDRVQS